MTSCCLEIALLEALRDLPETPILSENHFANIRKCSDCLPYLVLKVKKSGGLRTSDGHNPKYQIEVGAYFSSSKGDVMCSEYRDLVDAWVDGPGCLDLGVCGCFCVTGDTPSSITVSGDVLKYVLSFGGTYSRVESGSESV